MDKDSFYIRHILNAIEEIEAYVSGSDYDSFIGNSMLQSAVIRQIEIIGEAARNLSGGIRKRYDNVDWLAIIGMRNKLIQDYFEVDLTFVWNTAKNDVVILKQQIRKILRDLETDDNKN